MYSVTKKFQVEYAHRLIHLPEGHKCRNLHGHSGVITITGFCRNLDDYGFVIDFGDFNKIKDYLNGNFDHAVVVDKCDQPLMDMCKHLNCNFTVIDCDTSSSENLAKLIHDEVRIMYPRFIGVNVTWSETTNNFATYESDSLR